jgi:hypothetical protein
MSASITRNSAVKRLLLAIAGVAGIGAGTAAARGVTDGATSRETRTITLYARGLRTQRSVHASEGGVTRRQPRATSGELLDDTRSPVGSFAGAPIAEGGTFLHTFNLADGSIFGFAVPGAAMAHPIVGGTGRYAGAAGTYTVRPAESLPGHSSELTLTLTAWEV